MCASGVIRLIFTLGCIRVTRLEVLIACALAALVLLKTEFLVHLHITKLFVVSGKPLLMV